MERYRPRFLEIVLHQHGDHPSLKVRHGDGVGGGVRPVEVGVDPVRRQPVGGEDGAGNHHLPPPTLVYTTIQFNTLGSVGQTLNRRETLS